MGLRQREEMTRVCTTLQSAENGAPLQVARYCIKRPRQVSQQNIGIDRFGRFAGLTHRLIGIPSDVLGGASSTSARQRLNAPSMNRIALFSRRYMRQLKHLIRQ